jgi:hypothetical protein
MTSKSPDFLRGGTSVPGGEGRTKGKVPDQFRERTTNDVPHEEHATIT